MFKTVMSSAGTALMGIGRASGENRAVQAAQQAIESPLLEVSIDGARGIILNIIGGKRPVDARDQHGCRNNYQRCRRRRQHHIWRYDQP